MLGMNDIKLATVFKLNNEPYVVVYSQHVQMGRGGAILRTKLKNLITGNMLEKTFRSGDKVDEAEVAYTKANFMYADADNLFFMDSGSYEQFSLGKDLIGDKARYLKEGQDYEILNFDGRPISLNLPIKLGLKVVETSAAVRGDTAQGSVSKEAVLENGMTIKVPLFVKEGEMVLVNTETDQYLERVRGK